MSVIWLLFPIAFAADVDCLNISPNVTDEDCGNLDITMEYFDQNENCTQALFNEKFESLDLAYTVLYKDSLTAIFQKLKHEVWIDAQTKASAKYEHERTSLRSIYQISEETRDLLDAKEKMVKVETESSMRKVSDSLRRHNIMFNDVMANITQTKDALRKLGNVIGDFSELHNMYITIRAQSNRVHLCNAELRRVNENLMLRGVGGDGEQVLEECKDLLNENVTQKLLSIGDMYCSSPEATRRRRFLSINSGTLVGAVAKLTMAECIEHANYPDVKSLSTDGGILHGDTLPINVFRLKKMIKQECDMFTRYVETHLLWKSAQILTQDAYRAVAAASEVNRQLSYIAQASGTCATKGRTLYRKFKKNAELLAKAQACGQKMTEQWTKDVEKCLEANKWKSVWLPWYNLYNLLGENNNCVEIHNILVGCMVTAFATVVSIIFVASCLWRARNCSCSCFRRSKPQRSRRRKYLSDSDDSSDEEYYRRKHSLKARKKKSKLDGDDKKTRKHEDGRVVDKGHKKSKKENNNKKDRRDGKRDKKKNTAESVCDDSRKAQRENSHNPEAEIKMQWLHTCEPSQSSSWTAGCELGMQPAGNAPLRLQPRTTCIRAQTQPLKQDGFATVLENTRFHASPNTASMSTNDHLSVASGQPEFSRDTHLYQHNAGPRTERSNASRCEMNEGRSVACASSTNSRRQSIESDLEAPGNLFHLPNLFPNKVISPPISSTFPQIRTSADSTARFGMPFTPHVGLAHQLVMQRPSLTLPSSRAPVDLTFTSQTHTSLPMASVKASGQTATTISSSEAATVMRL